MAYLKVLAMRDRSHETSNAKAFVTTLNVPVGVEGELAVSADDLEAQRSEQLARLVQLKADGLAD